MKFERTSEYKQNLFMKAMCDEKKVHTDVAILIVRNKSKERAWCPKVNGFLNFPNKLRQLGAKYIADIVEVTPCDRATFYKVMNGSIREVGSEEVVG